MKPQSLVSVRPQPAVAVAALSRRGRGRIATIRELYRTLVGGGRWWLVPMLGVLAAAGLLLAVVTALEYVAPFVYTIF